MIIKTNYFLLLLYLYINTMKGSENKDFALFTQRMSEYNTIKNWAENNFLLKNVDYDTLLNPTEIIIKNSSTLATKTTLVENNIKSIMYILISNLNIDINNSSSNLSEFNKEGNFYFLHKKIITELSDMQKDLNTVEISKILDRFKKFKNITKEYRDYTKNPDKISFNIDNIKLETLMDYYNALMSLTEDKAIIDQAFKYGPLTDAKTIEAKWSALVNKIKTNFMYNITEFTNKNAKSIRNSALKITENISNIDSTPNKYKNTYLVIKNVQNNYQALLDKTKDRIINIPTLFNTFFTWVNKHKLLSSDFKKKYISSDIKTLTYDTRSIIIQKYEDLKRNYMGIITFNNTFAEYNSLQNDITNLEPRELYEFEDAYNLIKNAYIFYEKTTKKIYIDWASNNDLFSKKEVFKDSLANIIERIQNTLIQRIDRLSHYTQKDALNALKNSVKNQTTLSSLSTAYNNYQKAHTNIKQSFINWTTNNALLLEDEVKNASLEAVATLVQQELLKRINQLPKTQVNQQKIQNLQKTLLETTNLSGLSNTYREYLLINKSILDKNSVTNESKSASLNQEEQPSVKNEPAKTNLPAKKSWWEWGASWLPSWPFKR